MFLFILIIHDIHTWLGELPLLKDGSVWVAGVDRILNHFEKKGKDGNEALSEEQKADYLAYSTLVQENLYDCMLYTWYADKTNFIKHIRPTYAKLLSFPSCYYIPIQLKNNAKARLAKYNVEITNDDTGLPQNEKEEMKELLQSGWHSMYRRARETYNTLATLLDGKKYMMYDDKITTLDCIIFGYLSLHLYPNLQHKRLQHILTHEYPTLVEYCNCIKRDLFGEEMTEKEAQNKTSAMTSADDEIEENIPSLWSTLKNNPRGFFSQVKEDVVSYMGTGNTDKKPEKSKSQIEFERKRIWSIAGGITFFLAYVIYNGIVSVEYNTGEDDGVEDDEYYYVDGEMDGNDIIIDDVDDDDDV
ncbi:hypothetical protein BDF20DRAFT_813595 [Mycotypha africana]|uniref:uncharacterized protein n=1 Tax=Mycotypha africana TaxID=64632 RepID=UPI0023014E7A|nr:uncharacterized protein BDF20DRAFT_813595 [Mycotypha africana]KAI8987521.1 hypothetical protein BDF20DRAFT_813595 [Mycotypha africana]